MEEDLGALPAPPTEIEWEPCVDMRGQPHMRPVMPKPEPGAFVLQAEDVPRGTSVRPCAYAPGYLRYSRANW
jgi:hypothetical protein